MNKEIIQKIKNLGTIEPDPEWKDRNRELLLSQIGYGEGAAEDAKWFRAAWLKAVPQPVMAVILIVGVFAASGAASLFASKHSKPGDSLYIAKKLNEKAQLALAFDEDKKIRLGLEFAGERARELKEILDEEKNGANKEKHAARLVDDIMESIKIAKEKINGSAESEEISQDIDEKDDISASDEEKMVFSAGLAKDDKGLDVSMPPEEEAAGETAEAIDTASGDESKEEDLAAESFAKAADTAEASSSEAADSAGEADEGAEEALKKSVDELVEQTEKILSKEDGINADDLDELEAKADEIGSSVDTGEVKGEEAEAEEAGSDAAEQGTSTGQENAN